MLYNQRKKRGIDVSVIPINQTTEEDIKREYITPNIERKWKGSIKMEVQITDGRINLQGNVASRGSKKKADYILLTEDKPLAVVEAKNKNYSVSYGLQQAMTYAGMMDIPFAYSSNGEGFVEHDFLTGKERELALDDFPTMEELYLRYKNGKKITENEEKVIKEPYFMSKNLHNFEPRYYQRVAINRTVEAIARGQKRILLVMATGTGKTYTAFQIVYRLLKSGMIKKVLYLADRNILVDQSISQDFAPLKDVIHKVNYAVDEPRTITASEVFFALYQQLSGSAGEKENEEEEECDKTLEKMKKLFKPDFFDLVIVDECHRGSAKKDSNWRRILEYFSSAAQIGMTATPKETKYVSNISYFGLPIYTYSLNEGIEDGFLAPFKVIDIKTNIGDGWKPVKGQRDVHGEEIEDRIYNNSDYDYNIIIQDRIDQVAKEITDYLKSTDRMAKTIVFCPTEDAAERMRFALVNANSDMVKKNKDYVVRITGSDAYGKSKLDYFISVNEKYPVIATTSKLLSTGADCKMIKLIVLDEMIGSMTDFKQIIGRGTRLREKEGKTSFVVMDFRGVTGKFHDPDWDGPIEIDEGFNPNASIDDTPPSDPPLPPAPDGPKKKPIVDKKGCTVEIIYKRVSIYDPEGKLLKCESIIDYTKENIRGEYATLDDFIQKWTASEKKAAIKELLLEQGIDLEALKRENNMCDVDDFDFICHVAFDKPVLTRKERADNVKKQDFLSRYSENARKVLEELINKYTDAGIYDVEKIDILKLYPFEKYGTPQRICSYFGGRDGYINAVHELETLLYA